MSSLLIVGLLSILGQVVLLRELSVASYGIELIYLIGLGVWLLAGALGALVARWPRRIDAARVGALFGVFALVLPAAVVFVRASRVIFAAVPGAYLPFPQQLLVVLFAMAPVSVLSGMLFQWAARTYVGAEGTLAAAYGIESAGGVLGGLAATLFFKSGVQNVAVAITCALVAVVAALGQAAWRGSKVARGLLVVFVVAAAALLSIAGGLDRRMTRWSHPALVDTHDSPYGRVTVTRSEGQVSVFENDALWFDTEGTAAETFAHLVLLQHPNPRRVLLLGGGVEGLAAYALEHVRPLVYDVELNEPTYRTVTTYLPELTRRSLSDPNVHVVFVDPRRFLQQSDRYDLIVVAAAEPTSGATNRFYTREFFAACSRALNPGGIVGFKLQSSENFWTPLLTRRMVSVYRAVKSAFAYVVVLPGTTNIFIASSSPLPPESVLEDRLNARRIHATLVSGPYLRYVYTNDRRVEILNVLETGDAPENTDIQPISYEYAAVLWLSRFFPALAAMDLPTAHAASRAKGEWTIGLSILALFCLSRIHDSWRRALLIGVAGFLGVVLEAVLILHFQMKSGVIFQDIGVLLTGFMAGLAAGALGFGGLTSRGGRARTMSRWSGVALLGCLVVVGFVVAGVVTRGAWGGLIAVTSLLALTAALVAALFAFVSLHHASDQVTLVSPLYAADLVGGCAGSVLGSLVLIPIAGLAVTARWAAILALLSLALL